MIKAYLASAQAFMMKLRYVLAALLILSLPVLGPIYVDADSSCTPPPSTSPGVNQPVGADAGMFSYDCNSGLWVSAHYNYNPANGVYTPLEPAVYTYDPATGSYDFTTWQFDAAIDNYQQVAQSTRTPPVNADVVGAPAPPSSSGNSSSGTDSGSGTSGSGTNQINNSGADSNNSISGNGNSGSSIDGTGSGSDNNVSGNNNSDTNDNNTTTDNINTAMNLNANTGDTTVIGNTNAGDATSGDAADIANVMNLLQSTSNALGGNAVTFVANINGDVNGDMMFDPSQLSNIQSAGSGDIGNSNVTINNSAAASMNNNINLTANSGDATVADNTNAGNATSGSADTIANVVNLIDSAVSSGKSFLGVININGDLNGNIEVPSDFVNQMIAANVPTVNIVSNTGAGSNNSIDNNNSNQTTVQNTNNEGINNNIDAAASTGSANVSENTNAGNATSGIANTDITAFNLTGSNVIGANDLLVFVNVVGGSWVGLIVNAPAGATAAELGGGIDSDSSNNTSQTVNNNTNDSINNNIGLNSTSGDATVSQNTFAGNATSGNANDAVNLLNVENSTLSLSNWFGILFINVFGTWNGNFGVEESGTNGPITGSSASGSMIATPLAKFVSKNGAQIYAPTNEAGTGQSNNSSATSSPSSQPISNAVLTSSNTPKSGSTAPHVKLASTSHTDWTMIILGAFIFGTYLFGEQYYTNHYKNRRLVK
jgi:hypothetical protein